MFEQVPSSFWINNLPKHLSELDIQLCLIEDNKSINTQNSLPTAYFIYGIMGTMNVSYVDSGQQSTNVSCQQYLSGILQGQVCFSPLSKGSKVIVLQLDAHALNSTCPLPTLAKGIIRKKIIPQNLQVVLEQIMHCYTCQLFTQQCLETKSQQRCFLSVEIIAVQKARTLLLEDISVTPTLQDIAHNVGLHRTRLSMLFKEYYGQTIFSFLREERLRCAKDMLLTSNKSITDIAYSCGFSNPSHFTRLFTLNYGLSPKQYQRKQRVSIV